MTQTNGYCEVDRGSLYFEVEGSGTPLVLIQGFGLNYRYWDRFLSVLPDGYMTVRYDRRGFGASSRPRQDTPYSDFDDLGKLLDHLELDKVHILSECVGGQVALEMAIEHRERVLSLVLSNPDAIPGVAGANSAFFKLIEDTRPFHAADKRQQALEAAFRNPIIAPSVGDPQIKAHLTRAFAGYEGWHFLNWYPRKSTKPPVNEHLADVTVPTLIIRGGRDYVHFHRVADKLLDSIAGSRAEELPDAGHYAFLEFPSECLNLIEGFLGSA